MPLSFPVQLTFVLASDALPLSYSLSGARQSRSSKSSSSSSSSLFGRIASKATNAATNAAILAVSKMSSAPDSVLITARTEGGEEFRTEAVVLERLAPLTVLFSACVPLRSKSMEVCVWLRSGAAGATGVALQDQLLGEATVKCLNNKPGTALNFPLRGGGLANWEGPQAPDGSAAGAPFLMVMVNPDPDPSLTVAPPVTLPKTDGRPGVLLKKNFCFRASGASGPLPSLPSSCLYAMEATFESPTSLPLTCSLLSMISAAAEESVNCFAQVQQRLRRESSVFETPHEALNNGHYQAVVKVAPNVSEGNNSNSSDWVTNIILQPVNSPFSRYVKEGQAGEDSSATFYAPSERIDASNWRLGSIKFEVAWARGSYAEGLLPLDSFGSNRSLGSTATFNSIKVELREQHNPHTVGHLLCDLTLTLPTQNPSNQEAVSHPSGGLVDLMNLTNCDPDLSVDFCPPKGSSTPSLLGHLMRPEWAERHHKKRMEDTMLLKNWVDSFRTPQCVPPDEPTHERRTPSNFKPSSAKLEPTLWPLPTNLHTQLFRVSSLREISQRYLYTTCGAPCLHSKSSSGSGLSKLEAKRDTLSDKAVSSRVDALRAIREWQGGDPSRSHVPPSTHISANTLREIAMDIQEELVELTWEIAWRRSVCLCQALSIGLTSYLNELTTESGKENSLRWAQYGYLICFGGMLSAVGKELHMIEDAVTSVEMLRGCSVILEKGGGGASGDEGGYVAVKESDYIEAVKAEKEKTRSGIAINVTVRIEEGVYNSVIPDAVKGKKVRFYPVLFQAGVDVKQWGKNFVTTAPGKSKRGASMPLEPPPLCADTTTYAVYQSDILYSLNLEGYRKLTQYYMMVNRPDANQDAVEILLDLDDEHFSNPYPNPDRDPYAAPPSTLPGTSLPLPPDAISSNATNANSDLPPYLTNLWGKVSSPPKKLSNDILDLAHDATSSLCGGNVIFCKSGKDRTGMGVTLRQARKLSSWSYSEMIVNLGVIRELGTRIEICNKNVGKPCYAFNALQTKFMPDTLKPPSHCLAKLFEVDS